MMHKKRIIFTADDLGLSEGINRGIIQAFQCGAISSASLVANGAAFESAAKAVKDTGLEIGIHFTFLEEKPILCPGEIRNITIAGGRFFASTAKFFTALYLNKAVISEVEKEARAQIEKILDAGIKPAFFNSHHHLHLLPGLFRKLISLAQEYKIKNLRLLRTGIHWFGSGMNSHKLFLPLGVFFLDSLSLFYRGWLKKKGFGYANYSAGILENGHINKNCLLDILKNLRPGTTEIVCHPGIFDHTTAAYRHWHYHWDDELSALLSVQIKDYMREHDIEMINFKELNY